MPGLRFGTYILLLSMLVFYTILSSLYRPVKAYLILCWVPITLYVVALIFNGMEYRPQYRTADLDLMLRAIVWTSLAQGLLGVGVTIYAAKNKEPWLLVLTATALVLLPFILG